MTSARSASGSAATVYVPPEDFAGDSAELSGDTYRHLFRARRLAVDDGLRVVDGRGRTREGRIAEVKRDRARVELGARLPSREPVRQVSLLVAPPRPERAAWLVEKATEMGVARVAWLDCERSARRLSDAALKRQGRVAVAALQQCGGATLPVLSGPHEWSELGSMVESLDTWWTLDPAGDCQPGTLAPQSRSAGLVIGPEGGWSDSERAALEALGGRPWSLGARVLRVETAALVGAAVLLSSPEATPAV